MSKKKKQPNIVINIQNLIGKIEITETKKPSTEQIEDALIESLSKVLKTVEEVSQ